MEMTRRDPSRGSPDEHHATAREITRGDETVFSIRLSRVLNGDGTAGEHQARVREIETSVRQGIRALHRIEADVHGVTVSR